MYKLILYDFWETVKAATLIFISEFHLLRKGNKVIFIICKDLISYLSRLNVRVFHENPDNLYNETTFINL